MCHPDRYRRKSPSAKPIDCHYTDQGGISQQESGMKCAGTPREMNLRCIVHDPMVNTPPPCLISGDRRSPLRIRPDYGIHALMRQDGFRNITLHQMEALIRLVETGSFTHAAERMALSQPTLTKHIRNLEELSARASSTGRAGGFPSRRRAGSSTITPAGSRGSGKTPGRRSRTSRPMSRDTSSSRQARSRLRTSFPASWVS